MLVGINYPWLRCGWDFGAAPPGYGARTGMAATVAHDFQRLRAAGASVVRWFILADGFSYGTGAHAPERVAAAWHFSAEPALEQAFLDDFEALLRLCAEFQLRLLPVLLDFHCGFPGLDRHTRDAATLELWDRSPALGSARGGRLYAARARAARLPEGYVKGGRVDIVREAGVTERFLDNVLAPLLQVSRRHAHALYAWELINEPEWIVRTVLSSLLDRRQRVDVASMQRFLRRGLSMIADHGFEATVGFAKASTLLRWDRSKRPLGLTLNQVHYYPASALSRLHSARYPSGRPSLLGELASHPSSPRPWPDLPASRQDPASRLKVARDRGYQAALLWSYRARDRATDPDRDAIEAGLAHFTALRGRV